MKQRFLGVLACLIMAHFAPPAHAQTGPYAAPNGFALLSSSQAGKGGQPAVLYKTTPDANTNFSQWGAPGDFPKWNCIGGTCGSEDGFSAVNVTQEDDGYAERLMQNGADAPCDTPAGGPSELDLFMQPAGLAPGYASNADFPALSALESFSVDGIFTAMGEAAINITATCKVNHAVANYGVTLIDDAVQPPQYFWYSVELAKLCVPGGDFANCSNGIAHPQSSWVWTGAGGPRPRKAGGNSPSVSFFVSDPLSVFQPATTTDGEPVAVAFDFLPRLSALITSGDYGVDKNLSHWRLAGLRYGQSTWGNTVFLTTWEGFETSWTLKAGDAP